MVQAVVQMFLLFGVTVSTYIICTNMVMAFCITTTTSSRKRVSSKESLRINFKYVSNPKDQTRIGRIYIPVFATNNIVDAEFVKLNDDDDDGDENQKFNVDGTKKVKGIASKTLLDMSLESDREFMTSRIPFVDTTVDTTITPKIQSDGIQQANGKNNYIDIKLAFMVTLDNTQYGIGVPYDTAVAITYEKADGTIEYISPDNIDDNDMIELIAIMATQVNENIGSDIQLQHTPRVLTISGPMEKYTKDWETKLLPKPINATQLLDSLSRKNSDDNDDEGLDFFHKFMKEELGQEEYDRTMNDDDVSIDDEMMKLFDLPGQVKGSTDSDISSRGNNDNNQELEEMKELLSTLFTPEKDYEVAKEQLGIQGMYEQDGYAALKLISYMFANGVSYSLVKLLQPYIVVGKYVLDRNDDEDENDGNDDESIGRFELLLPEEEQILIPRLEEICQDDLEKANLQFRSISKQQQSTFQ